jgi:hypothetical protein
MCFTKAHPTVKACTSIQSQFAVKILRKTDGELRSPYRKRTTWQVGEKKIARRFNPATSGFDVHYGFHCFKNLNNAIRRVKGHVDFRLFLVEIPPNTEFYDNETEFCSKQLRIVSEIKIPRNDKRKAKK